MPNTSKTPPHMSISDALDVIGDYSRLEPSELMSRVAMLTGEPTTFEQLILACAAKSKPAPQPAPPAAAKPAEPQKFEQWAIVELMGHQRMAGFVTEATIGGASLLRIDVPEAPGHPAYTRYIAPAALYAINPTNEATARAAAVGFRPKPVQTWELPALPEPTPLPDGVVPAGSHATEFEDDEDEDRPF